MNHIGEEVEAGGTDAFIKFVLCDFLFLTN